MQDLHLLQHSVTNTVTEYQNNIHGCFPLLESNLDLWDGIGVLPIGCWSAYHPEPLKNLHIHIHFHKPSSPISQSFIQTIQQGCSTDAFRNYIWFDVLCYTCYPFKYVSLHISQLFSTHSSRCHKTLTHPLNNPKRNQILRLSIQTGCYLSI